MAAKEYATVFVLDIPYVIDKEYTYYVPVGLREQIDVGAVVTVPFGAGDKRKRAFVTGFRENSELEITKSIASLTEQTSFLTEETAGLCRFMKQRFFCTFGAALKTLLPPGVKVKSVQVYTATEPLLENGGSVYRYIVENGSADEPTLTKIFPDAKDEISRLLRIGAILRKSTLVESVNRKTVRFARLTVERSAIETLSLTAKQKTLLSAIADLPELPLAQVLERCGSGMAVFNAVEKKGYAERYDKDEWRNPYETEEKAPPPSLSPMQTDALNTLKTLMDSGEPKAALLYGVTGSGKTKVIISAVRHALDCGKTAIVLLPEIGLTAQAVGIFKAAFGKECGVIHSMLSDGERTDTHRRIALGELKVIIGTRSAIFAPLRNIGIIAIDEEQEYTYKSEKTPKYHARDIARYRCAHHNALMLLASATPSVESFYKAQTGVYTLVPLTERYGGTALPSVTVSDLRGDNRIVHNMLVGETLLGELKKNRASNEQSILFVNRRGYNSHISCRKCGTVFTCPNCSVSLTYHAYTSDRAPKLMCHYCGYTIPKPTECPKCASVHIGYFGYGTQLLQDELSTSLPETRTLRMDTDTTAQKFSHDALLESFREREADILYGTQMVAKGLDFPGVSLVGIVSADTSLYMNDFRASERTFALITQLIGRAGRAGKQGRAVIQTYNPDHEVIKLASTQDYVKFYEGEIKLRKAVVFPPFCDIAIIGISGESEQSVAKAAEMISAKYTELINSEGSTLKMIKFGPYKEGIYKLNNVFRQRIIIKYKDSKDARAFFDALLKYTASLDRDIHAELDINPSIV